MMSGPLGAPPRKRDLEKLRKEKRARYWSRKLSGACVQCQATLLPEWGSMCPECLSGAVESTKKYRKTQRGRNVAKRLSRARYWREHEKILTSRKRIYQNKLLDGICVCCSDPATDGNYCDAHAELTRARGRASAKKRRAARVLAGLCVTCGGKRGAKDGPECSKCYSVSLAHRVAYGKKKRAEWRAAGLCGECGRARVPGRAACEKCLARKRASKKRSYWARKSQEAA